MFSKYLLFFPECSGATWYDDVICCFMAAIKIFSVVKKFSPSIIDGTNYDEMLSFILHLLAFSKLWF